MTQLADALTGLGDEVEVVAPGPATARRAGLTPVGRSVGVPFNDAVAPIALVPTAARRTVAALRELDPDVVHVHEPAVPWVSLAATLWAPVPVVATFHAWSDSDHLYRASRPLMSRLLRRIAIRVAVSNSAQHYHARALGVARDSFTVVPNGVEVARFTAATPFESLRQGPGPSLLFVGRLEPRKGLEQLVRAFIILKATRPSLRLLVVGEGGERDRCQRLLPARLRTDTSFLGRVEHDDLPRFFASADLFVSPATGGESFGIVLAEAMAAGCPLIASDIPGYRGVVTDGVDGRLIPPGDPRALARAIDALLDSPALRAAMAAEGRRTVRDYDWPVVAQRLRRCYLRAVDAPATR